MDEFLEEAIEELKRVDHLIYVSLKYTRTVDVFKSILERLIACYDIAITGILEKAKSKKKVAAVPTSPVLKAENLKKLYASDEVLTAYIGFYIFLRRLNNAEFTKKNEYRRRVTMTSTMQTGEVIEVTMEGVHSYYDKTKEFINYIRENVK